jgi:hypothetical protein
MHWSVELQWCNGTTLVILQEMHCGTRLFLIMQGTRWQKTVSIMCRLMASRLPNIFINCSPQLVAYSRIQVPCILHIWTVRLENTCSWSNFLFVTLGKNVSRKNRVSPFKQSEVTMVTNTPLKVKVNWSLCFIFNWAPRHEGVLGKWRYSYMHSLTSTLDEGE